uniref:universal stress protein n=1 Tax=Azospirillum argentinense TaxID=2970906 RepID=UPI001585DB71|nr:universal stress protein [Azospirillum argentinense]
MPIRDILVHVGSSPACADRLALAADLARRYDARLIGAGAPESPAAEDSFRAMLRSAGVVGEWRGIIGLPESFVARHPRRSGTGDRSRRCGQGGGGDAQSQDGPRARPASA